jgi:PTH1 family peptidyl-tRNA hydrolase
LLEIFKNKTTKIFENNSSLFLNKTRKSKISNGHFNNKEFELIFSEGFINESGDVFFKVFNKKEDDEKKKIIVIYDDIALPFGEIKISFARGDGGHNGVKDIIKKLESKKFIRIRIGVCPEDFFGRPRKPKGESMTKYLVNKKFSKKQFKIIDEIEKKVEKILEEIFTNGLEKSMNIFNNKKKSQKVLL